MVNFLRAQVSLDNDDGIPRDRVMNTYHFQAANPDVSDSMDGITSALEEFYDGIGSFLSSVLAGTGSVAFYELTDAEPRAPLDVRAIEFDPGPDKIPNEVAICLSLRGDPISGVPAARRRGRIFLGPLSTLSVGGGTGDCFITEDATEGIGTAANALFVATAAAGCPWRVLSRTILGSPPWTNAELLAASFIIVGGYVDNAFDTIRSRGAAPLARSPWTAP